MSLISRPLLGDPGNSTVDFADIIGGQVRGRRADVLFQSHGLIGLSSRARRTRHDVAEVRRFGVAGSAKLTQSLD